MSADAQTAVFLDDKVIAQAMTSDLTKVEGNWYFKETALVDRARFASSDTQYHCGWKGDSLYFNYTDDSGKTLKDIAWSYPTPITGAEAVAGRVAFDLKKYPNLRVGVPPIKHGVLQ